MWQLLGQSGHSPSCPPTSTTPEFPSVHPNGGFSYRTSWSDPVYSRPCRDAACDVVRSGWCGMSPTRTGSSTSPSTPLISSTAPVARCAAPPGRVHRIEDRTELGEHRVDHDTDLADRMIDRDQILGAQRGQHRQLRIGASTHAPNLFDPATDREHPPPNFSTLNPRGLSLGSAV